MDILEIIKEYALTSVILSLVVMFLVGFVKCFTKRENQTEKTKAILSRVYVLLALVFSIGVVFLYHYIYKLPLLDISTVKDVLLVYGCSQTIYPVYEKYGGRFIIKKVIKVVTTREKKEKTDDVIAVIEEQCLLTNEQRENLRKELKKCIK